MYINTFYTHTHTQYQLAHIYTCMYAYVQHTHLTHMKTMYTPTHTYTQHKHTTTYRHALESSAIASAILLG